MDGVALCTCCDFKARAQDVPLTGMAATLDMTVSLDGHTHVSTDLSGTHIVVKPLTGATLDLDGEASAPNDKAAQGHKPPPS